MKFLDLFAGIGGFRLGMEAAGHTCIGFVEWDKYARKSYEAIHDTAGEWTGTDITKITHKDIPAADCWTFGFPCQDISIGGKQNGFKGERSSLFFTVTKLLRGIKEESPGELPEYLFIENVKNFLSVNDGWDFFKAQVELDEIGYDLEWELLNSREFGLAQNRERLFIVGHLRSGRGSKVFPIERNPIFTPVPRSSGFKIINMTKQGFDYATDQDAINIAFPGSNTRRGRVGRGYVQTLDTQCTQAVNDGGRWRRITPNEAWKLQGFPQWAFDRAAAVNSDSQLYKQAGNSVSVPIIRAIAEKMVIEGGIDE